MASNAFKAATLTSLALAMIACKTETIETPVIDVIQLSDLQINLGSNLKVGSAISAQTIRQGISANLSINDGEKQRKNLENLFNEFKDKKTFNITVTNNGESVYTITKDGMPTNGYTFSKEENNFKVSVNIGDDSFSFSKAFSVAPKEQQTPEQGGHEEGKDPTENPDEPKEPVEGQGGSSSEEDPIENPDVPNPPVTEDPVETPDESKEPAPETPEYIVSASFSTALESYQEEDDTDLLKELRISVMFDGDGYSGHTKMFNLEELYGWLYDYCGYFEFALYSDSNGTEEPLYSFSKGWHREASGILLNAEGTYSYRCTLHLMVYWIEEFSGDFSVNILPETGTLITIRSAALLWNINANALPSPPQKVTLTSSIIKAIGDAASGKLARYKTEERLASNLDAARAHYGIDDTDATTAASALAAYIGGSVVIEKTGTRDIGNDYGVINVYNNSVSIANRFSETIMGEIYPLVKDVESYSIKGNIVLSDMFYYNEIDIVNAGASISASEDAVFSIKQELNSEAFYVAMSPKSIFDMYARLFNKSLKDVLIQSTEDAKVDSSKTPTLDYYIHGKDEEGPFAKDVGSAIVALHKLYGDNKDKLNLDGSLDVLFEQYADGDAKVNMFEFQGSDFFKTGETMFKGNSINPNNDIPNMSADILREVSTKYNINVIENVIITGNYKEAKDESVDINSYLTNVVFEGNVSGLKNSQQNQFNGVVYFMDKPYNNRTAHENSHHIGGLLKLDTLEGVDHTTFGVSGKALDLSGRKGLKKNPSDGYTGNDTLVTNHLAAAYFTTDNITGINNEADKEAKIETFINKINRSSSHPFSGTVYVDNFKNDNLAYSSETAYGSKTPRTLEEFEYYGNNGKFETSAYDSYKGNFNDVNPAVEAELKDDKESGDNGYALNNRKIDFIDPETKKIIFSVLNDRQYNA